MARKPKSSAPSSNLSIEEAISRAYAHWNAGQADQAELFCQRILAAWPGQSDALHLMGVMAHAYGNLDLAISHLRHACLAPRAPAVYFSNLAEMCRQKGLLSDAEEAGRRAVLLHPQLADAWNNLGIILQEAGKLEESLTCLERVIALRPNFPEAYNNLANTCKHLGRLDAAETWYAKAIALNPGYAEAYSNQSNLLNDLGQADRAEQAARRAIELNPQLADAYVNLAAVECERRRYGEALRWLDAMHAFAPHNAAGLRVRAMALKDAGFYDEAIGVAKQVVALFPEGAEGWNILGQVYQAAGKFEDALAAFDKAAFLPGLVQEKARINRAAMLMEMGKQADAKVEFSHILEAFPHSLKAYIYQADLHKFQADDPYIKRMEEFLENGSAQAFLDRMGLHFSLGKAYLDIGDSDRAFHHLHEGNRMKRSTLSCDIQSTGKGIERIAKVFSPTLLKKHKASGNSSSLPIFIVGMPRSGTTLVEQILASHPQVHGAGELPFLQQMTDEIAGYPHDVKSLDAGQLEQLGSHYLAQVMPLATGKRHVIDKMPANFMHVGLIRMILPNARIIHCRRDPVDTCLSCYSKLFFGEQAFAYDLAELGQFHVAYQKLVAHWRKVLPADRFLEVDYEAVVDDLDGQAHRLLDFLELPWDDACLSFYKTKRVVKTASLNQVRQPIYKTSTGRWKSHAAHLGPLLEALGISA